MKKYFSKLKNLHVGLKASIAFFLASIVTKGIAYIVTPIYTRILPAVIYGEVSVFMTWVQVLGIIAMFSLSAGVFNNGMVDYPEERDEYSFSMLILSNIITLFFTGSMILLYPFIESFLEIDFTLLILMCVLFFFQPAYNFWIARQRYEMKYKYTVLWTILTAILSPLFAVICIFLFQNNILYARIMGANITLIVIYAFFYIHLAIKSRWKLQTKFWLGALLFNLPLIPHYLSSYLLGNINKLLISNLVGSAEAAYYSVAYSISTVVTIVWGAANASLIPYTYENCKAGNYRAISKATMPILTIFAAVSIVIMLIAPELIIIMATKEYMEAVYIIPASIASVFFQVQYYLYANIIYYYKKTKYVLAASMISVFVNFIVGYYLILNHGYLLAGYATLISYLIQATIDYFAMKKILKTEVYDMKFIGMLSSGVIILALICNYLYQHTIIRYLLITIILIAIVAHKDKIINNLKGENN